MCGFLFNFSTAGELKNFKEKLFIDNFNTIIHRGPDEKDFIFKKNYAAGSCRLKIFDLKKGKMPLYDESKRFFIIYNGEIYNFKELKKKYHIKTDSETDTEVLLKLYITMGESFLNELNGMYSFIIYDTKKNTFFCARDRLGIKPLYYMKKDNEIIISSEIKPLLKNIKTKLNEETIMRYLSSSYYDYGSQTFFENILQLEPGHYMKLDENGILNIKKYWNVLVEDKNKISPEKYEKKLDHLFEKAFNYQIQSDTKVGINVSEGVDSLCMLEYLNLINKGQGNILANSFYYSDFGKSKKLLEFEKEKHWKINYFEISPNDISSNFEKVFDINDGPFPGIPTIAKYLLIKRAYDSETKVILEGQGGDDIFGGYKQYFASFIFDQLKNLKFLSAIKNIAVFSKVEKKKNLDTLKWIFTVLKNLDFGGISHDGSKNNIQKEYYKKYNISMELLGELYFSSRHSNLKKIMFRDIFFTKLQRILKSCDRCSMGNSKELRVPLLDHEIVKIGLNNIDEYFFYKGNIRHLYRQVLFNKFNNKNFFSTKVYVDDPQTKWMKGPLFDWAYSLIEDSGSQNKFYNIKTVLKDFEIFKKDENQKNSNYFWRIICLNKLTKFLN